MTKLKTIKERAEEMMNKMSKQLEIPYSPTMISIFIGLLEEYNEDINKFIDICSINVNGYDIIKCKELKARLNNLNKEKEQKK